MKKNLIAGLVIALGLSFAGVSFAAETAAPAKPATETAAPAKAEAAPKAKAKKKTTKKKSAKKPAKAAATKEVAPEAGK